MGDCPHNREDTISVIDGTSEACLNCFCYNLDGQWYDKVMSFGMLIQAIQMRETIINNLNKQIEQLVNGND